MNLLLPVLLKGEMKIPKGGTDCDKGIPSEKDKEIKRRMNVSLEGGPRKEGYEIGKMGVAPFTTQYKVKILKALFSWGKAVLNFLSSSTIKLNWALVFEL